jgi:surface protein
VPLFNTQNVNNMEWMFSSCVLLQTIPSFNLSATSTMAGMFNACSELVEIPVLNVPNLTTAEWMFNSCSKIKVVSFTNVLKLVNIRRMFNSCSNLEIVNIPIVMTITSMDMTFSGCSRLTQISTFSCSPSTGWTTGEGFGLRQTFNGCSSLKNIPITFLNTENVQDFREMFYNCNSLIRIPGLTISNAFAGSGQSNIIGSTNTNDLNRLNRLGNASQLRGIKQSISFERSNLEGPRIVDILNNLATASTTQSIYFAFNPGTSSITPSDILIATNKNWRVFL